MKLTSVKVKKTRRMAKRILTRNGDRLMELKTMKAARSAIMMLPMMEGTSTVMMDTMKALMAKRRLMAAKSCRRSSEARRSVLILPISKSG